MNTREQASEWEREREERGRTRGRRRGAYILCMKYVFFPQTGWHAKARRQLPTNRGRRLHGFDQAKGQRWEPWLSFRSSWSFCRSCKDGADGLVRGLKTAGVPLSVLPAATRHNREQLCTSSKQQKNHHFYFHFLLWRRVLQEAWSLRCGPQNQIGEWKLDF